MKIYTRNGDQGNTGLYGGESVCKDDRRLHAYGTLDELSASLGIVASGDIEQADRDWIHAVQSVLLDLGAHIATSKKAPPSARDRLPDFPESLVKGLETDIDNWEQDLEPLSTFILPGGTPEAAGLHMARTICRRGERWIAGIPTDDLPASSLPYLNRLSDALFVLARRTNMHAGKSDIHWRAG